MHNKKAKGFGTLCNDIKSSKKKLAPHTEPIYASSGFLFDDAQEAMDLFQHKEKGFIYSRWGNPTVEMCADKIALLETFQTNINAKAYLFSSGMAAITAAITSCVKFGEKILTQNLLYGTTLEFMQVQLKDWGIELIQTDLQNFKEVEKILQADSSIQCLYIESPSNPLIEIFNIKKLSEIAKQNQVLTLVDNTFATPYLQQPLNMGADVVVHSTTKFLNGHGSGIGGVVIGKDIEWMQNKVWNKIKLLGSNSNAWDAWLILNGIKTLELRMQRHCANAKLVASFLSNHKKIAQTYFPGLKNHKEHLLAKKQMVDFGSLISFELKGGLRSGIQMMNSLKLCKLVTTLGTTDTILLHPASMSHVSVSKKQRLKNGITDGLVRISVGIENIDDILSDLDQALKYA